MEPDDLAKVRLLYERSRRRDLTQDEEMQLRQVFGRYSRRAWELPQWGLLDVAEYALRTAQPETPA
jgi:hypothetical protein